jgi:hypothetical protein
MQILLRRGWVHLPAKQSQLKPQCRNGSSTFRKSFPRSGKAPAAKTFFTYLTRPILAQARRPHIKSINERFRNYLCDLRKPWMSGKPMILSRPQSLFGPVAQLDRAPDF